MDSYPFVTHKLKVNYKNSEETIILKNNLLNKKGIKTSIPKNITNQQLAMSTPKLLLPI
jgi:hypothetical protein